MIHRSNRYFLLFMVLSFLGWAAETLFFFLCYGKLYDRGFMTLPFCTIYGFSFLLMNALSGVPGQQGGLFHRETISSPAGYFFLAALLPTALELVTGYVFHHFFGLRLWSYTAYRFHFRGYICLEYALLWGILVPPCMKYLFAPLRDWTFSLPATQVRRLSSALALLAAADWTANFARQLT